MDPALLRERELFKKRAIATPTVEKKKSEAKQDVIKEDKNKIKPTPPTTSRLDINSYKTATGSSQYRFGVLAKIVKHMKTRHQKGETFALTLDEILDETNQLDIGSKVKHWLQTEALLDNPKIEATSDNKFLFKPPHKLKDKKSLLKLLKHYDLKSLGGIMMDDVQESLPHFEKALKSLMNQNEIVIVQRTDKKKILFYNSNITGDSVDEEFKKLWRSVAVDAMDDAKIEEYLEKQGITSMQDNGPKKVAPLKRKKPGSRKQVFKKPRDNEHLADVLETYDDNTLTQRNNV